MQQKSCENKRTHTIWRVIGRIFAVIGTTLLAALIALFGCCALLCKGPSPTVRDTFVTEVSKKDALRWIPSVFLSTDEIQAILDNNTDITTQEEDVL